MGQLSFSHISPQTGARILRFLNQIFRPQDLLNKLLVKPEEGETKDYGIGPVVASRIIKRRKELPGWRFTELTQLNGIKGLGQDKLDDLVDTFNLSSAEHLLYVIESEQILYENFPFSFHAITFDDEASFEAHTKDEASLRKTVIDNIEFLASKDPLDPKDLAAAKDQIGNAYIEKIYTAYLAGYAWAVWFYGFDADNWFAFDTMRLPLSDYLDESGEDPALYLFKGFNNGLIVQGISVLDLPVVVNPNELTVYLWTAELFD